MAITLRYQSPLALDVATDAGQQAAAKEQARYLEELDRYNAQLDEQSRQFDLGLTYGAQRDAAEMQQRDSLQARQLGAANYQQGVDWQGRLAMEQLNQQGQQEYLQAQTGLVAQQTGAQMARDLYQTQLNHGLSEAEAIQKAIVDGDVFTGDDQIEKAWQAYENRWGRMGLHRGSLQEIATQDAEAEQQAQLAAITSSFIDPFTGEEVINAEQWRALEARGMDPDKIAALAVKTLGERRQAKGTQLKEGEIDKKLAAIEAEFQWKQREQDENQRWQQTEHEQKLAQTADMGAVKIYNKRVTDAAKLISTYDDMILSARERYNAAAIEHRDAVAKATAEGAEGGPPVGREPVIGEYVTPDLLQTRSAVQQQLDALISQGPPTGQESMGQPPAEPTPPTDEIPLVSSPEEARRLPSGTKFRTPDGRIKVAP